MDNLTPTQKDCKSNYRAGGPRPAGATCLQLTTPNLDLALPARPVIETQLRQDHCQGREIKLWSAKPGLIPGEAVKIQNIQPDTARKTGFPSLDKQCELIGHETIEPLSQRPVLTGLCDSLKVGCGRLTTEANDYFWLGSLSQDDFEKEASSLNKKAWVEKKLSHIASCGRRARLAEYDGCHVRPWFPVMCHTLGCRTCSVLESKQRQKEYKPIIEEFKKEIRDQQGRDGFDIRMRFVTLTLKNYPFKNADEMVDLLLKSFSRLKDMRFGPRVLGKLENDFFAALARARMESDENKKPLNDKQAARQIALWEKFKAFFLAMHKQGRKNLKFRHFSKGIARLEWTRGKDGGHHFHLHTLWSSRFPVPQVLLELLWSRATRQGKARVDIRRVKGDVHRELLKYISKPWEMSTDEIGAVLLAVRNRKKIWTWGLDLPESEEMTTSERATSTNDHCSDPNCRLQWIGFADLGERVNLGRISALRNGWAFKGKYQHPEFKLNCSIKLSFSEMRGLIWEHNSC